MHNIYMLCIERERERESGKDYGRVQFWASYYKVTHCGGQNQPATLTFPRCGCRSSLDNRLTKHSTDFQQIGRLNLFTTGTHFYHEFYV